MIYDYLIVGAGLFGAVFAYEAPKKGRRCLNIECRNHIAGNIYCKEISGIKVLVYGAHIFHTSNTDTWNYINQFAEFNNYINSPIAICIDELYNMPLNVNTICKMWGIKTSSESKLIIQNQITGLNIKEQKNLEEQALSLVGKDVHGKLVKGYTKKQWGRDCKELPTFLIKHLPIRFTFNNNYFNNRYQRIPLGGYTKIVENILEGTEVLLNIDYIKFRKNHTNVARKIIYTGMLDEYFDYNLGELEYRSIRFETERLGNAVMNYTEREIPYTRIIEHKHFEFAPQFRTGISKKYSSKWHNGDELYYPIDNELNDNLYNQYKFFANKTSNCLFDECLGDYKYYDADKVIETVPKMSPKELG